MAHKRRRISATKLHDLLAAELGRTTAELCSACAVPMPLFRESASGPNWRLPAVPECNALCHTILLDIAQKLAREYDIVRERSSPHRGESARRAAPRGAPSPPAIDPCRARGSR